MLLEGSYVTDVETVLNAFKVARRHRIREGEVQVRILQLLLIPPWMTNQILIYVLLYVPPTLTSPLSVSTRTLRATMARYLTTFQINERTLQVILSAATLPSYGLRSIEKYIQQRFPEVGST